MVFELYLHTQFMDRMRRLFLFVFALLMCQVVSSQVSFPEDMSSGADSSLILQRLHVDQDPRLDKMLKWHIENNKKRDGISGYRVEIYFNSDMNAKEKALRKKVEFLSLYPEYNVHIKFVAPNFKVRVGDFRTKNEALKLQKNIQKDYPGAFIVPDIINFPLLKPENYERPD